MLVICEVKRTCFFDAENLIRSQRLFVRDFTSYG